MSKESIASQIAYARERLSFGSNLAKLAASNDAFWERVRCSAYYDGPPAPIVAGVQEVRDVSAAMARRLYAALSSERHVCLFEDPVLRQSSESIVRKRSRVLRHEEEVYYVVTYGATVEDLILAIKDVTAFDVIAFVLHAEASDAIVAGKAVSIESTTLRQAVDGLVALVVMIEDGEGFLYCERNETEPATESRT
jgi:hypothetical protein